MPPQPQVHTAWYVVIHTQCPKGMNWVYTLDEPIVCALQQHGTKAHGNAVMAVSCDLCSHTLLRHLAWHYSHNAVSHNAVLVAVLAMFL